MPRAFDRLPTHLQAVDAAGAHPRRFPPPGGEGHARRGACRASRWSRLTVRHGGVHAVRNDLADLLAADAHELTAADRVVRTAVQRVLGLEADLLTTRPAWNTLQPASVGTPHPPSRPCSTARRRGEPPRRAGVAAAAPPDRAGARLAARPARNAAELTPVRAQPRRNTPDVGWRRGRHALGRHHLRPARPPRAAVPLRGHSAPDAFYTTDEACTPRRPRGRARAARCSWMTMRARKATASRGADRRSGRAGAATRPACPATGQGRSPPVRNSGRLLEPPGADPDGHHHEDPARRVSRRHSSQPAMARTAAGFGLDDLLETAVGGPALPQARTSFLAHRIGVQARKQPGTGGTTMPRS